MTWSANITSGRYAIIQFACYREAYKHYSPTSKTHMTTKKKKEKNVTTGLETTLGQRNVDIKWSPTNVWGSTCVHKEKPRTQIPHHDLTRHLCEIKFLTGVTTMARPP